MAKTRQYPSKSTEKVHQVKDESSAPAKTKKVPEPQRTVSTQDHAKNNISASSTTFWTRFYALWVKHDSEDADLSRSWPLAKWCEIQRRQTTQWKADQRAEALGLTKHGTKITFAMYKGGRVSNGITRGLEKRKVMRNEKGNLVLMKEVYLCFHLRGKIANERIIDVEVEI